MEGLFENKVENPRKSRGLKGKTTTIIAELQWLQLIFKLLDPKIALDAFGKQNDCHPGGRYL